MAWPIKLGTRWRKTVTKKSEKKHVNIPVEMGTKGEDP